MPPVRILPREIPAATMRVLREAQALSRHRRAVAALLEIERIIAAEPAKTPLLRTKLRRWQEELAAARAELVEARS